jgi:hypothetical protein
MQVTQPKRPLGFTDDWMSRNAYQESSYVTVSLTDRRPASDVAASAAVSCGDRDAIFDAVYSACGVCLLLSSVIGALTNGAYCYTIWTVRAFHSPFNLLTSHASVVDALLSAVAAPLLAALAALSLVREDAIQDAADRLRTQYAIDLIARVVTNLLVVCGAVSAHM